MYIPTTVLFFLFPLTALAGSLNEAGTIHRRHREHARNVSVNARNNGGGPFKVQDWYQGNSFLNDWEFFTASDPTHGNVLFQSRADAIAKGLAYVQNDGTTVLAVDDRNPVPIGGNRDSVRITSKKTYTGGLFIADFWAMPHGCSVWPAWWTVGPNWPGGGEIDILEGVHNQPTNQYTLHTTSGCTLSSNNPGNKLFQSNILNTQCASSGANNNGCAFADSDVRTYGDGFNREGGGVFAMLWNNEGIKIWHFARSEIPQDIQSRNPDPSTWPTPAAFWSDDACDTAKHFYDHSLVIDTTICGDWAGATYNSAGCPGSCAQAVADPNNFQSAKWKINYVVVYGQ